LGHGSTLRQAQGRSGHGSKQSILSPKLPRTQAPTLPISHTSQNQVYFTASTPARSKICGISSSRLMAMI
jgi:hypothetical protein